MSDGARGLVALPIVVIIGILRDSLALDLLAFSPLVVSDAEPWVSVRDASASSGQASARPKCIDEWEG
jgi:hypothetical protein